MIRIRKGVHWWNWECTASTCCAPVFNAHGECITWGCAVYCAKQHVHIYHCETHAPHDLPPEQGCEVT